MDFALVMEELGRFFVRYCSIEVIFNGYRFTVGSVYLFVAIAVVVIWFIRRMAE